MKKTYKYLILDIETANDTRDALSYDIGFCVADRHNNIYEKHSYIIRDIFRGESDLMKTAYYNKKIPLYLEGLKENKFEEKTFYEVKMIIKKIIEDYNIKAVCAYNAGFDINGLNTTQRWLTKSKYRWFLPYGTKVECIWHMACQTICNKKKYRNFCIENGYVSKAGNIQTSAEVVYKFLTQDTMFEEQHTGLEDVLIETRILQECYKHHKKMNKNINRLCWRIPQTI